MIESMTVTALEPGPHLLVLGAVHGDEPCGPEGIRRVMARLRSGEMVLTKGKVTFVPVANPVAYAAKRRFVVKNLNRIFRRYEVPVCEEERIADALCGLVEACDYLLDLHSFAAAGVPFVFRDYDDRKTRDFAAALGVGFVLSGWPDVYGSPDAQGLNEGDTVLYAHRHGKTAVLVECGQHEEPEAVELAERCIGNALRHLGLIEGRGVAAEVKEVRLVAVKTVPESGGRFVREWQNLDAVIQGDVLALAGDGTPLVSEVDGVIVMPKSGAAAGGEWFYVGEWVRRA